MEYEKVFCMHGYNIYKDIQETTVGKNEAGGYLQSICSGNGKEWDSKRPFAVESFTCLYSVSEERWSYSMRTNWMTKIQYLVDLRQGGVVTTV